MYSERDLSADTRDWNQNLCLLSFCALVLRLLLPSCLSLGNWHRAFGRVSGAHFSQRTVSRGCVDFGLGVRCLRLADLPNFEPELEIDPSSEACMCEEDLCNGKAYDESNDFPKTTKAPTGSAPRVRMSTLMIIAAMIAYLGF
jgi:hypothetical protein